MGSCIELLAEFISETNFDSLPKMVIKKAKACILDTIGVLLAGSKTEISKRLVHLINNWDSREESTIWGHKIKAFSPYAVLASAAAGFDLELDDVHKTSHAHPSISTIPAAFALCEKSEADGKNLIVSTVVGHEVIARVGKAVSPFILQDTPIHSPGFLATWGAVAASCKALLLSKEETINALSMCSLTPAATFDAFKEGVPLKCLYIGWAGMTGVMITLFSQFGFGGPKYSLEGELGIGRLITKEPRIERIAQGLGTQFEIMNVLQKKYPCCRQLHAAIDATLKLKEKYSIDLRDIRRIIVRTFSVAARANNPEPKTSVAAKYSMPYVIAVALIYGRVSLDEFTSDKLRNLQILNLAKKVKVISDKEMDALYDEKWPASVEIVTLNGKHYQERVDLPKGDPENPLTDRELIDKFITLATKRVSKESAKKILEMINDLEHKDVNKLVEMIK